MRNKRFGKLLSAALAAAMALSLSSAALAAGNGETHLTIIGTSDTHGNIWGYSYEDMKGGTGRRSGRCPPTFNRCARRTTPPFWWTRATPSRAPS